MNNVEFKARCSDQQTLRDKLSQAGIGPGRRMHQVDTYFQVPQGRLKLREIDGDRAELIYYERVDQAQARLSDYVRVDVNDPAATKQSLTASLGVRCVVDKTRELYLWDHTRVHLDTVAGLGTFMELETVVTDQSLEEARAECDRIRKDLGVDPADVLKGSYADMVPTSAAPNGAEYDDA